MSLGAIQAKKAAATIQTRAKGGGVKNAEDTTAGDPPPDVKPPVDPTRVNEVCVRLWGLCSPVPLSEFEPPWTGIALDLWARLTTALGTTAVFDVAAPASHLGYAAGIRSLIRASPSVHRILTDIRGLALATAPALIDAEKDKRAAPVTPGLPLVYEELVY